ncbi:DUF3500 domain-containing protein [Hymenobacter properus]|uniref:DUF3500 domain-containing protein n=1 Tax=Hymenobacter properus TaxID=2791026 RepID=A0A931BG25_9BACT|nr:DUF3500 domain-containing protein [Hymenobacter properus]MBF9141831.1 DUF3500 domain-containing protein [Hymenobacter properus]MBR7720639.1 DUF3500 domain-containing protein [Microvirga sp. SRT04]
MNKFLLAAPLALAVSAYDWATSFFEPAAPLSYTATAAAPAAPATLSTFKSLKGTQSTAAVSDVVNAANAFIASLSATQQATLLQAYNSTTVTKWSNLPVNSTNRIGLRLDALTAAQQALALAVVQAATGTVSGDGFNEIQQLRAADDNLAANGGGGGYGSGVYLIAFLGTPSLTGTWQLQFGGHHLATNITYGNGQVTGATPKFEGTEPLNFTTANSNVLPAGTVCAPLSNEGAAMLAMLNGLTAAQKTTARLSQSFGDVVLGPNGNGQFPATKVGLAVNTLTAAQQALVVEAMRPWVQDSDDATAASLMTKYTNELAGTYIAYSGTGNFTTSGDYARIDGPTVWIEFVCQNGVIYSSQIHYHTVWRDHARDYGGNFYGTYTNVLGTKTAAAAQAFSAYPNPLIGGQLLQVQLASPATAATYTLRNSLGQAVRTASFRGQATEVSITGLAAGLYTLSVQADANPVVTQRVTLE